MVRFGGEGFAIFKVAGFLLLQTSLAVLVVISVWAVFSGTQENYEDDYEGDDPNFEDDEDLDLPPPEPV
jgi:hypothetical protein